MKKTETPSKRRSERYAEEERPRGDHIASERHLQHETLSPVGGVTVARTVTRLIAGQWVKFHFLINKIARGLCRHIYVEVASMLRVNG